jgi:hypothetical protein
MPSKQAERLETGILKPEGDWPGVFIRGDEALAYARRLQSLFAAFEARAKAGGDISEGEISAWAKLKDLADLLESCRTKTRTGERSS